LIAASRQFRCGNRQVAVYGPAMTIQKIIVFGAGGHAGRAVVEEARRRGHQVTAVVREPARHPDLDAVVGDVTDAASIAAAASGHDVAIAAVYRADQDPAEFYAAAGRGLATGLAEAGVQRLLWVGVASTLPTGDGIRVYENPEFPAEWAGFARAHHRATEAFAGSDLDWVVVTPPMRLEVGDRTGAYRVGSTVLPGSGRISYADLAVALADEAENSAHHRTQIAVAE